VNESSARYATVTVVCGDRALVVPAGGPAVCRAARARGTAVVTCSSPTSPRPGRRTTGGNPPTDETRTATVIAREPGAEVIETVVLSSDETSGSARQ